VQQVGPGLGDVGVDPRVRQHPQPVHRQFRRQITARGRIHRRKVDAELPEAFEVGRVVDPFRDVVQGQIAHLASDPGSVETNRSVR
jgi:hypothetical protein